MFDPSIHYHVYIFSQGTRGYNGEKGAQGTTGTKGPAVRTAALVVRV
jgi:hypothetical protein